MTTLIILRKETQAAAGCGAVMAYHYDSDGQPSQEIVELFNTHILPTPFGDLGRALACISQENPQALVRIDTAPIN